MNRLNLLDTTVTTDNLGDLIIYDSIIKELAQVLEKIYVTNVSTHDSIGEVGRKAIKDSPISMMLGTNVLTGKYRINKRDMWRINGKDVKALAGKVLLCGTGWRKYQNKISFRQKRFYQKILNPDCLHSVRDSHSVAMLESIGIRNVVNTTCPTAWSLTEKHCLKIPAEKSEQVIFTLTRHKPDPADAAWVSSLLENYKEVFFWSQQVGDDDYLNQLVQSSSMKNKIRIIPPSLAAYDRFLAGNDSQVDFVGTRLHGGIRAMQHGHRSIIISVDNRATEIAKDINLPVVERQDIEGISQMINTEFKTQIHLPDDEIKRWKSQFEALVLS